MSKSRICPSMLAARWSAWCGDCAWTETLEAFALAGGMVEDRGGVPHSRSAIGLTFALFLPDGSEYEPCHYRLKDIRAATTLAQAMGRPECPV